MFGFVSVFGNQRDMRSLSLDLWQVLCILVVSRSNVSARRKQSSEYGKKVVSHHYSDEVANHCETRQKHFLTLDSFKERRAVEKEHMQVMRLLLKNPLL